MCSLRMWRLVRPWKLTGTAPAPGAAGCRLGPWAATVSMEDKQKPVLAIDAGTYLTVAFPLGNTKGFHDAFGSALGSALEDLGVDAGQIAIEVAAVKTLALRPLDDPGLRDALNTVDFVCGLELSYSTDLRTVQGRLNDLPHNLPPHYVPAVAVRSLFAGRDILGGVH
jgi:hypothetical protein